MKFQGWRRPIVPSIKQFKEVGHHIYKIWENYLLVVFPKELAAPAIAKLKTYHLIPTDEELSAI